MIQELLRDTVMIQELLALLIMGLFGLVVVTVIKMLGFGDDHHIDDTRQGNALPDHHDGEDPHDRFSWRSKTDLSEFVVRRET